MKILLLSDTAMSPDAGGLSQTLYNIFSFADKNSILCITSREAVKATSPGELYAERYLLYRFDTISTPRNRLGKYLRPYIDWFNYSVNASFRSFSSIRKKIKAFSPDVVVSCSNGEIGVFMHHKLLKETGVYKTIPYFMDDWMSKTKLSWLGGNIDADVRRLLASNSSWLMISNELSELLKERYGLQPKRVLEIHNPVNLSDAPQSAPLQKKERYSFAYAGSLWPMHFDAFLVIAKAVKKLNANANIELVVYTSADFWNWRKGELEPLGVTYGGNIPYKNIHQKLSEADALILTSSFLDEWQTHSKGSVQTKMTDYLKARRLIISCGPAYSANHNFIKKHQCGICIETTDVEKVAQELEDVLTHITDYQIKIDNGWNVLQQNFSFEQVHKKLQSFLAG